MHRSARVGGIVAGVAAGAVTAIWLLRDRILGPETTPVTPQHAPRFRVAPADGDTGGDDLTAVAGIGPVYRARLGGAGIVTFDALAAADATDVAGIAGVGVDAAARWVAQAGALAT